VEFEDEDWASCAVAFDFQRYGREGRLLVQERVQMATLAAVQ
jgi:hypothetical protein